MKRVLSVSIEPKSARPLVVWDPVKARAGIGFSVPSPAEATMVRRNPAEVADWLRARGKAARPDVTRARASALGEIFSLVDESETGALDAGQVREALAVLGDESATVEDAERAMARVGIAPNGKMEFPEFLAIVTGPEPATPRLSAAARSTAALPPELTAVAHRRARLIDRVVTNRGGARVRILERAEESARVDPLAAAAAERRLRSEVAANATRAKYMDYGDGADKHNPTVNETHATRVMRQKMARERRRRSMAYADGLGTAAMDPHTVYPTRPPTTAEDDEDDEEVDDGSGARRSRRLEERTPQLATRARERLARRLGVRVDADDADSSRFVESEWKFPEFDRAHRVARAARQQMALELADGARTFQTTCDLLGDDDEEEDEEDEEEEDEEDEEEEEEEEEAAGVPPAAATTTRTRRIAAEDDAEEHDDREERGGLEEGFDVPPHAGYRVRGGVRRVDVTLVSDAISGAGRAARAAAESRVDAIERRRAERAAAIKAWGEAWKAPLKPLKPPKPPGWEEVKATKIAALDARCGSDARVASEAARSVRERVARIADGSDGSDGELDGIEDALGTTAGGPLDVLGDSTGTAAQPGAGAVLCRLGLPDPNFVRLVDST